MLIDYIFEKYQYHKYPEGTNPVHKIVSVAKYGVLTGTVISIYDASMYSKCATALQFFNTAGYWIVPLASMGAAFAGVAYAATNIRKKDDHLNYFLGALASSYILHTWLKNPLYSAPGAFCLVTYAFLKKEVQLYAPELNPILPDPTKWNRTYLLWRNLPYRNYTYEPKWKPDREDYYVNFY